MHAVNIFRRGFNPHQNDAFALLRACLSFIRAKHNNATGSTWRSGQALGQQFARRLRIKRWVQQLVKCCRVHAPHGFRVINQPFARHIHRDFQGRCGGALTIARLQHIKLVALHREFNVLHVTVMALQRGAHLHQFGIGRRHGIFHAAFAGFGAFLRHGLRRANTRNHILTLRIDQVFAVENILARRRVAREAHAGCAILAHIAEDHGLHIDRRAPFGRDVMQAPIRHRALVHPTAKHRANRAPKLRFGILREGPAGHLGDHFLVAIHHAMPFGCGEFSIFVLPGVELHMLDNFLKAMMINVEHDRPIHLDEAPIGIPGKTRITGSQDQAFNRLVIQAQVQHRIHHARHGNPRAGTHRNQQRAVMITEAVTHRFFHQRQRRAHLRG